MNKQLLLFASLFAIAICIDLLKFLALGKPSVVNWESFIHPAWVIGAIILLFFAARFPLVHRAAFWLYFGVFAFAYINIYFEFTETITYFCMIFNLVLASVYFFSRPKSISELRN